MMNIEKCPVCDVGTLTHSQYDDEFDNFKGGTIIVLGLEMCVCDACESTPILSDQFKRNHVKINDARGKQ